MKTFNLEAKVIISVYTKVEAETLEEAIEIAEERNIEKGEFNTLDQVKESWLSDEYDGVVYDIEGECEENEKRSI